jgi:hypothetical protein
MMKGVQIVQAYLVTEELRALLSLAETNPSVTRSEPGWTASTGMPPPPTHARRTARPPPSKPDGQRSRPASSLASPTPDPRATAAQQGMRTATPQAPATRPTNAGEHAHPAHTNTGESQQRTPSSRIKSDEPLYAKRESRLWRSPVSSGVRISSASASACSTSGTSRSCRALPRPDTCTNTRRRSARSVAL